MSIENIDKEAKAQHFRTHRFEDSWYRLSATAQVAAETFEAFNKDARCKQFSGWEIRRMNKWPNLKILKSK